ncbi:MAG: tetratricopeptide repeat protein [Sphingomonas sp.]|nr:tetratricopeptide repeat protein [Sphingomonas sp.]
MKWTHLVLIAAAALGDASLVHAAKSNSNGSEEIMRGDYAAAEALIDRQRKLFTWDSDLTLNLAIVYRHTNRADAARALYQRMLQLPDEEIEIGDRVTTMHAMARRELASMGVATLR